MAIVKLDDNNFKNEIASGITLVDFYADWCGPCKMIAPFIDQLASEVTDVKIAKLDVDSAQVIAAEYGVMSIPTIMVFKDGQAIDTKVGFVAKEQLNQMIEEAK